MSRSDKMFLIAQVRIDKLAEAWEAFREFLVPAFVAAKNTNPYTQRDLMLSGETQLWAVVQVDAQSVSPVGIFFTGIVDDDGRRVVDAHTMSGKYLPEWAYLAQNVVERFALENDCKIVRFMGRRALSRIYHGYRIIGDARPGEKLFERILS
jgi:hypothetical protein